MSEETNRPFRAEVLEVKGDCTAGHKKGDVLSVNCYDSGGLCGFFYHDIFPNLSVMQFGASTPGHPGTSLSSSARTGPMRSR